MAEPYYDRTYRDPRARIHETSGRELNQLDDEIGELERRAREMPPGPDRDAILQRADKLRQDREEIKGGSQHQSTHSRVNVATIARAQQSLGQLDPTIGPASYTVDEQAIGRDMDAARGAAHQLGQYSGFRGDQQFLAGNLRDAVQGRGPSIAEATLNRGLDAGMRQNTAMALTGSTNPALARRQALQSNQLMAQQGAMDAGILRAQEMAQNRALLAGVAESGRAGDLARNQAGYGALAQQAAMTQQQQLALNAARNEAALTNAQLAINMAGENVNIQNAREQARRDRIAGGIGSALGAAGNSVSLG